MFKHSINVQQIHTDNNNNDKLKESERVEEGEREMGYEKTIPFNCGSRVNLTISFYFIANDSIK